MSYTHVIATNILRELRLSYSRQPLQPGQHPERLPVYVLLSPQQGGAELAQRPASFGKDSRLHEVVLPLRSSQGQQGQQHMPLRSGLDPAESSSKFWIPALCQPGMLLRIASKFYIVLGSTPAVLYAARLAYRITCFAAACFASSIRFCGGPPDG